MQISHLLKGATALMLAILPLSAPAGSQDKTKSSPESAAESSRYPNTAAGLQQLLQAMLEAAKSKDSQKLTALLKDTEVPNCDAWLHTMYESDKADSWIGLCDETKLGPNERSLMELLANLANEDGHILTRKVNDDPEPGRGMEWGWLQAIKKPLDIYFVSWKTSKDPKSEPVGYFMFIDGAFRWDSGIWFVRPKISTAKFVPAKLVKKVDPAYPSEAAFQHVSGTVRVYYVIGGDGAVYNAHAISGEGLSDDPSLRKAAEEAVIRWRYQPATLDGKPVETNAVTVDIVFSPEN
jgi:TonB family protein